MTWTLPEPMLAATVTDSDLPPGWAAEPKWDGWRALLSWDAHRLILRSRRGTDLEPSFPELRSSAREPEQVEGHEVRRPLPGQPCPASRG
ncbi:hypothetical protein [Streptomyces collinus]|uniref:hypothetical protein n=1 Tax=Streptomyces collinus TaxID=42684 RepID=UPI0036B03E52